MLDTATALKSRHQAQHAQHGSQAGAVSGPVPEAGLVQAAPGLEAAEQSKWPVVATLEYGNQMVHIEALAVNKDCVAVAGHCPVIR